MKTLEATIDGKVFKFGPLLAATVRDLGPLIRRASSGEMQDLGEQIDLAVKVATASMRRVDPQITEDDVANLVDMSNYTAFYGAAMGQLMPETPTGEWKAGSQSG